MCTDLQFEPVIDSELGGGLCMKKEQEYPEMFMLHRVNKYSPCQFLKCFDDDITLQIIWFLDLII
jgi:hypothetical protein